MHVVQWAAQWGTSNKVVQLVGSMVAILAIGIPAYSRVRDWPARLDFWMADYALAHARLAGISKDRIINCWPVDKILEWARTFRGIAASKS